MKPKPTQSKRRSSQLPTCDHDECSKLKCNKRRKMRSAKSWISIIHPCAHLGAKGELERQIKRIQDDAMGRKTDNRKLAKEIADIPWYVPGETGTKQQYIRRIEQLLKKYK